jgi:hypothetical protein
MATPARTITPSAMKNVSMTHPPRMVWVCRRSVRYVAVYFVQAHSLLKADANVTHGERHAICFCLPADGTNRPILNGDLGTSPFYGQHMVGNVPACPYLSCLSLAALVARIAIANLPSKWGAREIGGNQPNTTTCSAMIAFRAHRTADQKRGLCPATRGPKSGEPGRNQKF